MPELPEVETVKNVLVGWVKDKKITNINVIYKNIIDNVDVEELNQVLRGSTIIDIKRKGKFLIFEFDNDYRLFFASQDIGDRKRIGTYEIRKQVGNEGLCIAGADYIACRKGKSYAERVVDYDEEALAFFGKEAATVLCPSIGDYGKHNICAIQCSKDLVADFTRKLMLQAPESVEEYCEGDLITAMKIRCGDKYLYLKTTDYYEIEMKVSREEYDPSENCFSLRSKPGERLFFTY